VWKALCERRVLSEEEERGLMDSGGGDLSAALFYER
jgi:hypothetical protein